MAQRRATTAEAVLAAAAVVFAEKGYEKTTLDDIARETGISKPTVYRYAQSKQWLLDGIVKKVQTKLDERMRVVWEDGLSARERLRRLVRVNIALVAEYNVYCRVAFMQTRDASPRVVREFELWARSVNARTRRVLELCVEEGVLDLPGDLSPYVYMLQSMLASTHRWFHVDGALSVGDLTDRALWLLAAGERGDFQMDAHVGEQDAPPTDDQP